MGIDASVPPCNMRPGRRERRWLCALLAFVYMVDRTTVVYACVDMYQVQYICVSCLHGPDFMRCAVLLLWLRERFMRFIECFCCVSVVRRIF